MNTRSLALLLLAWLLAGPVRAEPSVRAVFFYSPTCPHCHEVLQEDLPPLLDRYGEALVVMGVNVMSEPGGRLFRAVMDHFAVPEDERGVPALVIGERLLLGSLEIPRELPAIVAAGLAAGGIAWPALAGLDELLTAREASARASEAGLPAFRGGLGPLDRFALDPLGNGLSVAVLAGMLAALALTAGRWFRARPPRRWPPGSFYALIAAGLGVAGYLSFVELGEAPAVCGPVGDCNTVQQSPYAEFFGIPVAVLGLGGYALLLALTLAHDRGPAGLRAPAALARFAIALAGTLLSCYFTFLEPFVIGATCLWCLTSAVLMTALLWASTPAARAVRHGGADLPQPPA